MEIKQGRWNILRLGGGAHRGTVYRVLYFFRLAFIGLGMLAKNNWTGRQRLKFSIPGFYIFRCHIFSRGAARTILPALAVIIARAKECYVQADCVGVRMAE